MTSADQGLKARFLRVRRMVLAAAVAFAAAAPLLILFAAVGTHLGWLGVHVGFDILTLGAARLCAMLGGALGVVALLFALAAPPRTGAVWALIAIAVGAVTFSGFMRYRAEALSAPPVHDVATDWRDPILFSPKLMQLRGADANPIETNPLVAYSPFSVSLAGQRVADVNARTCKGATPVVLMTTPAKAYAVARRAILQAHLKLVNEDPQAGILEATATTFWFGFKDDVAVRVRPEGAGSRIDIRASARVGLSDLGRGCRLVTRLRGLIAG